MYVPQVKYQSVDVYEHTYRLETEILKVWDKIPKKYRAATRVLVDFTLAYEHGEVDLPRGLTIKQYTDNMIDLVIGFSAIELVD